MVALAPGSGRFDDDPLFGRAREDDVRSRTADMVLLGL